MLDSYAQATGDTTEVDLGWGLVLTFSGGKKLTQEVFLLFKQIAYLFWVFFLQLVLIFDDFQWILDVFFSFVWFARKGALWSNFEVTMSTSTRYNLEFTNMTGWKTTMNIIWVDVSTLLKNGSFPRQPSQFFGWVVDHQESEVEAEPEVTEVTVLPTAAGIVEPR